MIKLLILINVTASVAEVLAGDALLRTFALWPLGVSGGGVGGEFLSWQSLTYAFLHADGAYLVFNILGLYLFGRDVGRTVGAPRTWQLCLSSILSAAFAQLAFTALSILPAGPVIGTSGDVFGLLLAYIVLFPSHIIVPLIPPIPMPAWVFMTLYAIVELTFSASGTEVNVAHFAHPGGMAGSGVLSWHWLYGIPRES